MCTNSQLSTNHAHITCNLLSLKSRKVGRKAWKEHCQSSLTILFGNMAVAHSNLAEFRENLKSRTSSQNVILKADFPGAPYSLDEIQKLLWSFESVISVISPTAAARDPELTAMGQAHHMVVWGAFTSITRDYSILPHRVSQLLFGIMKLVISSTETSESETEEICRNISLRAESMLSSPHSYPCIHTCY